MKWVKLGPGGPYVNKDRDTTDWGAEIYPLNDQMFIFTCVANGVTVRGPARTLKEAKANCEAHVKRYGRKP